MAKKRNTDPEPQSSTAAARVRQPRKRTTRSSSTAPAAHSTPASAAPVTAAAPPAPVPETTAAQPAPKAAPYTPPAEEIARLAYHYWQARGCPGGSPEEDWFRAEHDLRRGRSAEAGA